MTPRGRGPRLDGLALVGLVATVGAGACAPPCYDDGLLQGGCPQEDTDSNSGTGSAEGPSSITESTTGSGSADGESGVISADGESGSTGDPVVCPGLDEDLVYPTRSFQFVVDQSDAMMSPFDGSTRWNAVEAALVHPANGLVTQQQSLTRFGLSPFHGLQAGCPLVESVPPQLDSADEITLVMSMEAPGGSNPVADAIDDAVVTLNNDAWMGDKTLVLLTADEPATCATPSPANALQLGQTRDAAIAAVMDAFAAGYPTIVVSIDDGIDAGHLQELANAGAGVMPGDPDAPFFVVHDDQELEGALDEIVDVDRSCSFALANPLPAELVPGCTVEVNGAPVTYDDPDGWTRPDDQTLELLGGACDAIQLGDATVEMVCDCDD